LFTVKIPLWDISWDGDPDNGEKIFEVSVRGWDSEDNFQSYRRGSCSER